MVLNGASFSDLAQSLSHACFFGRNKSLACCPYIRKVNGQLLMFMIMGKINLCSKCVDNSSVAENHHRQRQQVSNKD